MSATLLFFLYKRDRDLVFVSANIGFLVSISDCRWGNGFSFKADRTNGFCDYRSYFFSLFSDELLG